MALRTAFPLKSDEEINELVTSAQSDPDGSDDSISSQRLHSLLAESVEAGPPALEESEGQAAENPVQATD
ncbi:Translin-associated factor X-interacting protein 1 [Dissostichus eleginoides]|uniref:Translin-associated factor X-interacting protein 1 n=2 Tax=Nototheniidae TaxID=8206 RepID=A0AAD9F370_DISEL|nr:Translin-associated factor X-interacting protein 1 [Dissostichus eleginoides]